MLRWVLFVVLLLGFADVTGRYLLLTSRTRFDLVRADDMSNGNTLFVYFPGILADGVTSSQELVPTWRRHGDVLLVSYEGRRFKGDKIVADTAREVYHLVADNYYENVVFLGSSMGGLLSYDTIQALEATDLKREPKFKLVLMDAPTKRSELQSPLDKIALGSWLWWAGPISNLISKPYFALTFVGPNEENIEPEVDRSKLDAAVAESKSFKLSWAMDQNRFIIGHSPVERDALKDVDVVYVRSTRDNDTVRPEAFDTWALAAGRRNITRIEVDSTHVGFNERPDVWRKAFGQQIIPALGLN